jgi:prepilin-type N-terminal cleavage/methylation domain-containing protein
MPLSSPFLLTMRRGFSLVELLVVIGIIAVMAGLVLSSLFRNRDSNRLLAAEHVLADAIRQARHTARSNNAPVELRIVSIVEGSQVIGARVSGVTRVPIWGETFDGNGQVLPEINTPQNGWVIGRSGNGRIANAANPIPGYTFERRQALVRGNRSEGFYIACQVRPPVPGNDAYLPLLIIGDNDNPETSQCGLALRGITIPLANSTSRTFWWVQGWVFGDGNQIPTEISTLNPTDRPLDRVDVEANRQLALEPDGHEPVIAPDRWVDLGLLYDGERLMLFADGRRIAVHHGNTPEKLKAAAEVFIGQATIIGNPNVQIYNNAPMDDIRLYRLGTSEVGDLPGGVVLVNGVNQRSDSTLGYRILCHSDGRVEVYRDDDTNKRALNDRASNARNPDDATITLSQRLVPGSLQKVKIRVGLDGRVNSELVRP